MSLDIRNIVIGQRWVSHTDSSLGLGVISAFEGRRVELSFPAVGERRHYAIDNAPIGRIVYSVGNKIADMDDMEYMVTEVMEIGGIVTYRCEDAAGISTTISELDLSCFVQFSSPDKRLLSGQLDDNSSYELRYQTFQNVHRLNQSPVNGLLGARVELLPHQLYIAHEVAMRDAPRVLLADEVGLGKTIEAGMILHHQLHTGRASRALILVPDSLLHQWLVELLRRFNLQFALFDESRFSALIESPHIDLDTGDEVNPFETEQLVIASIDALVKHPDMQKHVLDTDWDLLVVDEAHHLQWSESASSDDYLLVEALSRRIAGLLLLTATPEQAGVESHFARLRLLDPERFFDIARFKQESEQFANTKQLAELLMLEDAELELSAVQHLLPEGIEVNKGSESNQVSVAEQRSLLNRVLDQYGPGRVLFRNTRSAISGFPSRLVHPVPLSCPEIYGDSITGQAQLMPEQLVEEEDWLFDDPRVAWLAETVLEMNSEAEETGDEIKKILVICHHASTAISLQKYYLKRLGFRSSSFHEHLSLFERDRAAAYFADREDGAQLLFCSEIGSEGRNFQFAHHLVLFDLPLNPDLIEQRIGRLDRIGQKEMINIHVPYLKGTAQEVLFNWYDQGLNLFESSFAAAYSVYEEFAEPLSQLLEQPEQGSDLLVKQTQQRVADLTEELQSGRDKLLELNSCRQPQAGQLVDTVVEEEQASTLANYFSRVLEEFGVEQEEHSPLTWVLRPGDHMKHDYFPGLKDDGNTVTLDRSKALSREDIEFLSWEHPMVNEAMESVVKSDIGNATVATVTVKGLQPGTLLLEAYFNLQSIAPKKLQINQYLPIEPLRVLIDSTGKNLSAAVNYDGLCKLASPVRKKLGRQIVEQVKPQTEKLIKQSEQIIEKSVAGIKAEAIDVMTNDLEKDKQRLVELQKNNPNIRASEILLIEERIAECRKHIERSKLQIQGLRLVVAS